MKNKKFIKNNDAMSGVIETVLLVALIAIILGIIQTVYIPEIMTQQEQEHMNEVEKQFSNLKATIDIQSITREDAPVVSIVTLGNKELPYFVSVRSTGFMRILNENKFNITVTTDNDSLNTNGLYLVQDYGDPVDRQDLTSNKIETVNLTSIKYKAYNYYISDEDYILEGGMFILEDSNGENIKIKPDLKVLENKTDYLKIKMNLPIIRPVEGKEESSAGDYGPCYIRTSFYQNKTYSSDENDINNTATFVHLSPFNYSNNTITSIKIYTDYIDSWYNSINDILEDQINNGYINIEKNTGGSSNYVEIENTGLKNLHIYLQISYIDVQIGPGVIKS